MCLSRVVEVMLYLSDLKLSLVAGYHVVVGGLFLNNPELLRYVFQN